jgi:hypothetical protein
MVGCIVDVGFRCPVVDRTIQLHDGCIMHVTQDPLAGTASKELPCSCSQVSTMPRINGIPQSL